MNKQAEKVMEAFSSGQRMTLGRMTGKAFRKMIKDLRKLRGLPEAA